MFVPSKNVTRSRVRGGVIVAVRVTGLPNCEGLGVAVSATEVDTPEILNVRVTVTAGAQ